MAFGFNEDDITVESIIGGEERKFGYVLVDRLEKMFDMKKVSDFSHIDLPSLYQRLFNGLVESNDLEVERLEISSSGSGSARFLLRKELRNSYYFVKLKSFSGAYVVVQLGEHGNKFETSTDLATLGYYAIIEMKSPNSYEDFNNLESTKILDGYFDDALVNGIKAQIKYGFDFEATVRNHYWGSYNINEQGDQMIVMREP